MRRQEMDHDLLRQRQAIGRGVRHKIETTGAFVWEYPKPTPEPIEQIKALCVAAGASPEWFATIAPGLGDILRTATLSAFERGSRDAQSRAANRPGDGDMGG